MVWAMKQSLAHTIWKTEKKKKKLIPPEFWLLETVNRFTQMATSEVYKNKLIYMWIL